MALNPLNSLVIIMVLLWGFESYLLADNLKLEEVMAYYYLIKLEYFINTSKLSVA